MNTAVNRYNETYLSIINEQEDIEFSHQWDDLQTLKKLYETKETIIKADIIYLLIVAANDEMLATYNYLASYMRSVTEGKADFDPEFKAHEEEECEHMHLILERIHELEPESVLITNWCDIANLVNSAGKTWKQEFSNNSAEIISNRYKEELDAVEFYTFLLETLHRQEGPLDTTTKTLIEHIKADEEEHAKDLRDLMVENNIKLNDSTAIPAETAEEDENEDEE